LSSFSGLEDKALNYHLITYEITEIGKHIQLTLTHENIQNEQSQQHAGQNWEFVLNKIKEISETDTI
jgi:hypothetical protein